MHSLLKRYIRANLSVDSSQLDDFVKLFKPISSFIMQKPSFEFVNVLEDSELLSIRSNDFYKLVDEVPRLADFYRKLLEFAYSYQNEKLEKLVTLTAIGRHGDVMKNRPEYIKRLSNHVLASYLNMSQETLSRLKSS